MPQIVRYSIPKTAYPRYEYSLRHHVGFIDRVLSMFKKLDAHTHVQALEFSRAEIDVLRLSPSAPIVDEITIQQRPTEKVEANTKTINTIESYLGETPLDGYDSRLLVISLDEVPDQIDIFREHLTNILFICKRSDTAISLKEKIGEEDDLIVTTKAELGKEIAFALERVVFRNIAKVVPALRSMSEDVSVLCNLQEKLRDEVVQTFKMCTYTPFLKALEKEFDPKSPYCGKILSEKCVKHGIVHVPSQWDTATPGYFKTTEVGELTIGECTGYQIYKISKRIAHAMSQTIISIYKSMPATIRDILPDTAHPIQNQIQTSLCDDFMATLYIHIVCERPCEPKLETTEDLLRSLRSSKKDITCEIKKQAVNSPVLQALHKHMKLIRDNRNDIADLFGEVRGMYTRSKVPQHERPLSPGLPKKKLSENVAKALFDNVERVKGCGYRYNKLTIFLDKEQEVDDMTVRGKIKNILLRFGIFEYDITPATKSVKHYKRVGAKVRVWKCGTLGGFAEMQQAPKDVLCALVSEHVVNGANELLLVQNGDGDVKIGSMIKAKSDSDSNRLIDVAAARILDDKVKMCNTSFKDTARKDLPSRLYDETNRSDFPDDYLSSLPVHIYGVTTKLGKGIITMPHFFANNPNKPDQGGFIIIEDVPGDQGSVMRFSKEGDSGAVICADDPDGECVIVISMLIGSSNYQDIERDSSEKGKYLTFKMTSALQKLESETGYPFELCKGAPPDNTVVCMYSRAERMDTD